MPGKVSGQTGDQGTGPQAGRVTESLCQAAEARGSTKKDTAMKGIPEQNSALPGSLPTSPLKGTP